MGNSKMDSINKYVTFFFQKEYCKMTESFFSLEETNAIDMLVPSNSRSSAFGGVFRVVRLKPYSARKPCDRPRRSPQWMKI